MKILGRMLDTQTQTIRPNVMEVEYGRFRGYVEVRGASLDASMASKVHFCDALYASRGMAERQAMLLAQRFAAAGRGAGLRTRLLADSLNDGLAGRHELDGVPAALLRRGTDKRKTPARRLRAVA